MEIGKVLLAAGAAYLGYRYLMPVISPISPVLGTAPGIQPGTTPPVTQPTVNAQTTQSLMQAIAAKNGLTMGTVDDWDWVYAESRGVAAPAPESWGITPDIRGRQMTFSEYWAIASQNGLSGIVPMSFQMGLGAGYIRG